MGYVLGEFELLQQEQYKNIWINDENFTFNLPRAKSILNEIAQLELSRGMNLSLSSWTHIDEEFLEIAKAARVSILSFGVESAAPKILEFYKKKIDLEKFQRLIRFAHKIGLYTVGNYIIGAPMESEATINETFDYIMETPFDRVNIKTLDYMAGSEIFKDLPDSLQRERHVFACKENGLNLFPLAVLKEKTATFKKKFHHAREKQIQSKIKACGPPYQTHPSLHS